MVEPARSARGTSTPTASQATPRPPSRRDPSDPEGEQAGLRDPDERRDREQPGGTAQGAIVAGAGLRGHGAALSPRPPEARDPVLAPSSRVTFEPSANAAQPAARCPGALTSSYRVTSSSISACISAMRPRHGAPPRSRPGRGSGRATRSKSDRPPASCAPRQGSAGSARHRRALQEIPPVIGLVPKQNRVPCPQLAQADRDIGARDASASHDVVGTERIGRQIEQRVNLPDRAVDAPLAAHLAEMELKDWMRVAGSWISEISGNYRNP